MRGMAEEKVREEWVDIARGIAMLLVVLGHMGVARTFIYTFHMPVFFFISGYLYKKRNGRSLLKYECKKIILPYLIWGFGLSIAMYGITLFGIAEDRDEFSDLRMQIINILNGGDLHYIINAAPALWFLIVLAEVVFIYWCISYVRNKYIRFLIVLVCATVGGCLNFINLSLRFNWNVVLIVMPFYYLGDKYREYKKSTNFKKIRGGGWHL